MKQKGKPFIATARFLYIEKHGRKDAGGLCMAVCPIGI